MKTKSRNRSHVLVVFGTRPEAIKMMPVVQALRANEDLQTSVVVTGQHRHMLDQVFTAFGEQPDLDLNLMAPNQDLTTVTANVLVRMGQVYAELKPHLVLVHGDTTSAMAAALAAFYARIKIGHVEAGLRSFDHQSPWPEEFNRVAIDSITDYLFAPTAVAAANLRNAGRTEGSILVTGNTGIDALLMISRRLDTDQTFAAEIARRYDYIPADKSLVLVTGHRRESFGDGFRRICEGLLSIAERDDVSILYPVHLNPNVQAVVRSCLGQRDRIHLVEPVDYADMVYLMKRAKILLTDSGGIQEEGPALGKPVLVMREVTERPEAIAAGAARLVGTDPVAMRRAVDDLLDDPVELARRSRPIFPFGDGTASQAIVRFIASRLS